MKKIGATQAVTVDQVITLVVHILRMEQVAGFREYSFVACSRKCDICPSDLSLSTDPFICLFKSTDRAMMVEEEMVEMAMVVEGKFHKLSFLFFVL